MDPSTALATAGNVLQFVQFVGGLLNSTRKFHASASGMTIENEHVQDIYSKLISFNEKLEQPHQDDSKGVSARASIHGPGIASCATACKQDCEELLRLVMKLEIKSNSRSRYWRSFQAALTEVWSSADIKCLKERIAERQRVMTLQLCAVSSENMSILSMQLRDLFDNAKLWRHGQDRHEALYDISLDLKERIKELKDHKSCGADTVTKLCQDLSSFSLSVQDYEREGLIADSLNYEDRQLRHGSITVAHKTTFGWALIEAESDSQKFKSLRRWLPGTEGLFWVSGKPGSGKSTFLKFIADHATTRRYLQQWAGSRELLIVSHYFTINGTPIQKSLDGLLRSLLHGIFCQQSKLISKLLPHRYNLKSSQPQWTQRELQDALHLVAKETDIPVSICFFIDGLDEYAGEHEQICQTLIELSRSPFIKVCVSSRPWNVFRDTLGDTADSVLYMQELNRNDIESYTKDKLCGHPRWRALEEEAIMFSSESLVSNIVDKSDGVFLWVTLVVRLLREGLTNGDSMSDLRRMLSSFPSDLKRFFRHIVESVHPFYLDRMARTLLVAFYADTVLPIEIYTFVEFEYEDDNYAFRKPQDLMPTGENLEKLFDSVSRRINGRCKGLLERNGDRMQFLHRTVYDFLRTPEMADFLRDKAPCFCPNFSLLQALVAWTKRTTFTHSFKGGAGENLVDRMRRILWYASWSEKASEKSAALTSALLDNMEDSIETMVANAQILGHDAPKIKHMYRHIVLEAGISGYMSQKLAVPGYTGGDDCVRLCGQEDCYFRRELFSMGETRLQCLQQVLKSVRDPNALYGKQSPWTAFLHQCIPDDIGSGSEELIYFLNNGVLCTLLQRGADPGIVVERKLNEKPVQLPAWLGLVFTVIASQAHVHGDSYNQILDVLFRTQSNMENIRVSLRLSGDAEPTEHNFWDVCGQYVLVRFRSTHEQLVVSTFSRILQMIPRQTPRRESTYDRAYQWILGQLSGYGKYLLESAISELASQQTSRPTSKRKSRSEAPDIGRQRKAARKLSKVHRK